MGNGLRIGHHHFPCGIALSDGSYRRIDKQCSANQEQLLMLTT